MTDNPESWEEQWWNIINEQPDSIENALSIKQLNKIENFIRSELKRQAAAFVMDLEKVLEQGRDGGNWRRVIKQTLENWKKKGLI